MRRLKKLTRYLLGTSEVYQELCPDPHAETLQVPVDKRLGLTTEKLVKAAVEEQFSFTDAQCSRGHARKIRELFRAQKPSCTALAQEQSKVWESAQLLQEWQYNTVPLLHTDSQSALAVCKRRGPGRMKHIELKMLCSAGMAENGTTSNPQSIDSRQSGRPHDQSHESRETDQVRTSVELARSILHRLEPLCTVTSD